MKPTRSYGQWPKPVAVVGSCAVILGLGRVARSYPVGGLG